MHAERGFVLFCFVVCVSALRGGSRAMKGDVDGRGCLVVVRFVLELVGLGVLLRDVFVIYFFRFRSAWIFEDLRYYFHTPGLSLVIGDVGYSLSLFCPAPRTLPLSARLLILSILHILSCLL